MALSGFKGKSKCLGLTKKYASLTLLQSLTFTIHHPLFWLKGQRKPKLTEKVDALCK